MIITSNKLGISRFFLNLTKGTCVKPMFNILLTGERSNTFPLRSGIRWVFTFNQVYSTIHWRFWDSVIRKEKWTKASRLKERSKTAFFQIIPLSESTKKKKKKTRSNVSFANLQDLWSIQNYLYFYILEINNLNLEF